MLRQQGAMNDGKRDEDDPRLTARQVFSRQCQRYAPLGGTANGSRRMRLVGECIRSPEIKVFDQGHRALHRSPFAAAFQI